MATVSTRPATDAERSDEAPVDGGEDENGGLVVGHGPVSSGSSIELLPAECVLELVADEGQAASFLHGGEPLVRHLGTPGVGECEPRDVRRRQFVGSSASTAARDASRR